MQLRIALNESCGRTPIEETHLIDDQIVSEADVAGGDLRPRSGEFINGDRKPVELQRRLRDHPRQVVPGNFAKSRLLLCHQKRRVYRKPEKAGPNCCENILQIAFRSATQILRMRSCYHSPISRSAG